MELIDQVLWEQELNEHLTQSGGEAEQFKDPAPAEPPAEPALQLAPVLTAQAPASPEPSQEAWPLPSFALVLMWVVVLMAVSSAGWAIGWYMF